MDSGEQKKSQFYEDELDLKQLRFGDVVIGYITIQPIIQGPILDPYSSGYLINVNKPSYCVVLTPCCAISGNEILLAPLIPLDSNFFRNPYLEEDVTRINRTMTAEQACPPPKWASFNPEEKLEREKEGMGYTFLDNFIYEPHVLLPKYNLKIHGKPKDIGHYMVNFKQACGVSCTKAFNPRTKTDKDLEFYSKILQLTIPARSELRDKMSVYYGKKPDEDIV